MTETLTQRARRVANVRFLDGGKSDSPSVVKLQLLLPNAAAPKTFQRPAAEPLAKTRQRIELAAANALATGDAKSSSRRQRSRNKRAPAQAEAASSPSSQAAAVDVRFFASSGQELLLEDTSIGEALNAASTMMIGDLVEYVLLKNAPAVERVSALTPFLAGIPVVPFAETLYCDPDECQWRWFRLPNADGKEEEELCCSGRQYTPTDRDVGCRLRIECTPPSLQSDDGSLQLSEPETSTHPVVLVTAPVEASPDRGVFDRRRELGKTPAHASECDAFRVMSYNVLFDGYTSDHAKRSKFAYADRRVVQEAYRMQLIAQEIIESNSDVVLLQEMGGAVFESYFGPLMRALGFTPLYASKTGSTMEGCAMLIRSARFEVVEHFTVDISAAVNASVDPAVRAVLEALPEVKKGVAASPTVAQIAVLQHTLDVDKCVVVSNTHLFFRYDGDLIRLLQTAALVEQVKRKRDALAAASHPPAILMGGDYNAFPNAAAVRYLLDGRVPAHHRHLQSAPSFRWDGVPTIEELREQGGSTVFTTFEDADAHSTVLLPAEFAHDLTLASGCGIPEFTNYAATPGHLFAATLDYIVFESERLAVRQVFPHFSRDEVSAEVALPSTAFPSDHVSIICDLGWQQR